MKKLIIILLIALTLTGCRTRITETTNNNIPAGVSRFVTIDDAYPWGTIVADYKTGVMYVVSTGINNEGRF